MVGKAAPCWTSWCPPCSLSSADEAGRVELPRLVLPTYLIVHDGSEAKDADMDIILLAHQAGVLQGPAPRESAVPGEEGAAGEGTRSACHHPDSQQLAVPLQLPERGTGGLELTPLRAMGEGQSGCSVVFIALPLTFGNKYPGSQLYNQCPNRPEPRSPAKYNGRCAGLPGPQDGSREMFL